MLEATPLVAMILTAGLIRLIRLIISRPSITGIIMSVSTTAISAWRLA